MDDDVIRADHARKGSPFLNTAQAAHYVGLAERTLKKMRAAGRGPIFRKHGRFVRYHIDDLTAWSAGRTNPPVAPPTGGPPPSPDSAGPDGPEHRL